MSDLRLMVFFLVDALTIGADQTDVGVPVAPPRVAAPERCARRHVSC